MLITYVRSSSYNNYAFCQMQYFITYVLGHRSDSGKKAEIGTIVHKTLEVLAGLKKFQQDNPKRKYLEVTDDVVDVGDKVKIHVEKFLTDSFVDNLSEMSYDAYTCKSKHHWTKGDFKTVNKLTYQALEYNDGQFDPRFRNVVDSEPHFDIPIEEDWGKYTYELPDGKVLEGQLAIKGTIDLVTRIDNDTIEVIDWKTGQRKDWATGEEKTYEKLCEDPQLLLYNYAISKMYTDYKQAIMTIFYVKDGGPFSMCFDLSDKENFLKMLKERFEDIKKNNAPKLLSRDRSDWRCTRVCHFYKNKWPETDDNMCIHIERHLKTHGMDETITKCTKPGFSLGHYEAPG